LSVDYGVKSEDVMAIMHDCASVNEVAMYTLKVLYPDVLGIGSFSHTLNCVGNDFMTYWVSLFSHSFKAQAIWKQQTGCTIVASALLAGGASGSDTGALWRY